MMADLFATLKATGIVRGFNATAEGAVLSIGPGLAYIDGAQVGGCWQLDFAGQADGWHIARMSGLSMYMVLLADGRIAALRDLRRWLLIAVAYQGGTVIADLGADAAIQRIAAALRTQKGATGTLAWLPLPGGHVVMHRSEATLVMNLKAEPGKATAVAVEYSHAA